MDNGEYTDIDMATISHKIWVFVIIGVMVAILNVQAASAFALTVASIQYRAVPFNKAVNIRHLSDLVRDASANHAKMIVLPEMCTTGLNIQNVAEGKRLAETIPGHSTNAFSKLAARYQVYLVLGLAETDPSTDKLYNSQIIIGPDGQIIGKYRKTHLFGPDHNWAEKGDLGYQSVITKLGRIGMGICADINYQDFLDFLSGAHISIFAFSTNWVGEESPFPYWSQKVAGGNFYFIAANNWGDAGDIHFTGGSMILSSHLSVLAQTATPINTILYANIVIGGGEIE